MYYVYHKLLNEIVILAVKWNCKTCWWSNGLVGWSSRETSCQADYPKYNHVNEKYNENDPQDNQEGEKYNEADPQDNQEDVDPKLVDFLSSKLVDFFSSILVDFLSSKLVDFFSSSQRRNTDSLQNKGLKWAADDLLCKCANVQKGQMCKCAKGQKGQIACEGEAGGPRARKALQGGSEPRPARTPKPEKHN